MSRNNNIGFSDGFWAFLIVVAIGAFALIIFPVSYEMSGSWTGDIQINKDDPHYGVWFMGSTLDKSTSLEMTGLQFHIKGSMPAYMVNSVLGGK